MGEPTSEARPLPRSVNLSDALDAGMYSSSSLAPSS